MNYLALAVSAMFAAIPGVAASCSPHYYSLSRTPSSPISQPHVPQFVSYSFEPAFWVEFFGEPDSPRNLTFTLLSHLYQRGARPIIRAGGITMDSMVFDANQKESVVRTENEKGGIYRTTIGPAFYDAWNNFPRGTTFVSTLNFGNNSVDIARGLANASYTYQRDKIVYYELGNEPTNYPTSRWNRSTQAYVAQWQDFTRQIDLATNGTSHGKWWASSATTDVTGLHVRPSDLIPAGINSTGQVGQYSIHSYAFATCDPARERRATISNLLNHTDLARYADDEIYPSAKAAMDSGAEWVIGEFNSIACSGKPNVSDTFAQALWTADVELLYAVRNATSVHLHQGATLVFQSDQQLNTPGDDGTPGFSSYSLLYPIDSSKRGPARVLPVFVSQLLVTEALLEGGSERKRIAALPTPQGLAQSEFSAYAIFGEGEELEKLVILNMKPFYAGHASPPGVVYLDIGKHDGAAVKRMTAPSVDEKDAAKVTWAGQSFRDGFAAGELQVEELGRNEKVWIRDSEAVLVTFNRAGLHSLNGMQGAKGH
ncbi:glycoside hydrolase family 79 protein [Canariomyces notabilis]|uniref:Glycoside hydrolase family 79 protein n=1 Tax=Canariomyces notabilis TaxID=2074819 RepID=A0AAN6T8U1_9PEZI|nr:glycoside hydrolase family 79 protein [Canariomyces arenarius]